MKRISLLIAALHASALAAAPFAPGGGAAHAQTNDEIRAYMEALSSGTPEAMSRFLTAYPNSILPGSELGATIAAKLDQPTASTGASTTSRDQGWRANDRSREGDLAFTGRNSRDGIY